MNPQRIVNFRLSPVDLERIQALCEHYALNVPSVIRMLVKREFDQVAAKSAEITKSTSLV